MCYGHVRQQIQLTCPFRLGLQTWEALIKGNFSKNIRARTSIDWKREKLIFLPYLHKLWQKDGGISGRTFRSTKELF